MNRKSINSNTLLIAALSCMLTATLRAEKPAVNTISAEGRAFFHATILHLIGHDHERLSARHAGLDFRLTGVEHAHVVKEILA